MPFDSKQVAAVLSAMADTLDAHKDELTELDMPIGDSDHGINMARGFDAVREVLPELAEGDVSTLLKKSGQTVVSKVGGSSGPLYGTMLRKIGVAAKGADAMTLELLRTGMEKGYAGIQDLGGAQPGDKTMLDAMRPALDSLAKSIAGGEDAAAALDKAATAAADGADATTPLVARKGRASYLGERSAGHKDPGATSFAYLMRTLADVVAKEA